MGGQELRHNPGLKPLTRYIAPKLCKNRWGRAGLEEVIMVEVQIEEMFRSD